MYPPRGALFRGLTVLLVAYLASVPFSARGSGTSQVKGATAPAANSEWPLLGGNSDQWQHSPLARINDKNVQKLGLAWVAEMGPGDGLVGNPLVADGVVYQSGPPGQIYANDLRTGICYTSGSTATPKPVLHSHSSEIFAATGLVAAWRMGRADRGLVALPLAWIYGLSSGSLALLVAGATVVLMTHFNPERVLERIQETRASHFFGSMSMYTKVLDVLQRRDFDLSSLRVCTNGAEPCPDASVRAFENRAGVKLTGAYALSEARPLLTKDPLDSGGPAGTCGRLVPGAAIRLLDASGQEVPTGAVAGLTACDGIRAGKPDDTAAHHCEIIRSGHGSASQWNRNSPGSATARDVTRRASRMAPGHVARTDCST
jgi:non-ribosomal peptide synthetase component F